MQQFQPFRKTQKVAWNLRGTRYELRQEQPLGTDAENNWFSMQSALKVRVEREQLRSERAPWFLGTISRLI